MGYVIATSRSWNEAMADRVRSATGGDVALITSRKDLTYENLVKVKPRYIFFPHWSYIIPPEVHENFECVVFHMTDVPFGRGGSPLQNLISRGIYETKITALRCRSGLDAGPVYMKTPFSLYGTAEEIYLRASKVVCGMIMDIINTEPTPIEQRGDVVVFARRKPAESSIGQLTELEKVFDHIRMLDAEGYPKAFLETERFRFEFQRPSLKYNKIVADVVITPKNVNNDN
ncbi:MAG: methionyl-tRNA formyltransferase [Syntrophales bacterium]